MTSAQPQQLSDRELQEQARDRGPGGEAASEVRRVTTYQKLQEAQALLRHQLPDGDLAAVMDRALTLLLREVKKRRCGTREFLEFHHLDPWARGHDHDPGRIALLCRAHNQRAAEADYGRVFIRVRISTLGRAGFH